MQVGIPPCTPDSHPYRITSTKCRINTVVSPDNGHVVARNTYRNEINILRKPVHQVVFIYKSDVTWFLLKKFMLNLSYQRYFLWKTQNYFHSRSTSMNLDIRNINNKINLRLEQVKFITQTLTSFFMICII